MSDPVEAALALWGLESAAYHFVAGRENRVYKVTHASGTYALRFKRSGYRSEAQLVSELDWLAAMDRAGLTVPAPLKSLPGSLLEQVDGSYVDLISWLDGVPLGQSRAPLQLTDGPGIFRALGREMAKLHLACDDWPRPQKFDRCHWDSDGLLGEAPVWGRFWENPTLDPETAAMLSDFRRVALRALEEAPDLDQGLIHADLVRENVMLAGNRIGLIDFDDGGYGYRLFDIATALLKNREEPDYPALKAALIEGYQSLRPIDIAHLDLFMALRAATYLGWIVPRMSEPGSQQRNLRFINDAKDLCGAYLAQTRVSLGRLK